MKKISKRIFAAAVLLAFATNADPPRWILESCFLNAKGALRSHLRFRRQHLERDHNAS
jgi:hypothetical protein